MKEIEIIDFKELQPYKVVWDKQKELMQDALQQKKQGLTPKNHIIFVEHTPVFTLGKSADENNILLKNENLGADVFRIERGGDVTFHGPGQLVVYPIIDLEQFNMGLREYVETIEQIIIEIIAEYGLEGMRSEGASGVWLDVGKPQERKICAVGIKASRYITMHGLAFNINTDLAWFSKINPCGFIDKGVTSLARELGATQNFEMVKEKVKIKFKEKFV
ncbi:MAG: lipoyl(octanoyl) transferase LipB [Chitinophagales bacterium]|nr:lipoyl(octanoyl) transferase LipB [Chitinophagales bacterium]